MSRERSFLGNGWAFPPTFAAGGADVKMVSGEEDIHQSLIVLLATQPGERVMHEQFGCDLNSLHFEEADQSLVNSVTGLVSDAILYHEPRIKLDRLDVSLAESRQGVLLITIDYTIRSTNSRYNLVYPFYLNEAATGLTGGPAELGSSGLGSSGLGSSGLGSSGSGSSGPASSEPDDPAADAILRPPQDDEDLPGINEMEVQQDFTVT